MNIISIHSAKGLEFDMVFLLGLEEGVFPSDLDKRSQEQCFEAGRLCYVAFTRPRHELILSYVAARDPNCPRSPSSFLRAVRNFIVKDNTILEVVKTQHKEEEEEIDSVDDGLVQTFVIDAVDSPLFPKEWNQIQEIAQRYPGHVSIHILTRSDEGDIIQEDTGYSIALEQIALSELQHVVGSGRKIISQG